MISMNWVKDYVDLDNVDLIDLADKITTAGVNVESVLTSKINNLVIGEIIETRKHPDSDHLNICQVNLGNTVTQIVCGASNVRPGLKVVVATPGALLPDNFLIKSSTIRGEESNGMICALYELGLVLKTQELYDAGIEELGSDAVVGTDPLKYLGYDDTLYNLDLNPNRMIDCTNHLGFAYEVASVLGLKVKEPDITTSPITESILDKLNIEVETENCSMYNAKMVKNLKIQPSPKFMQERILKAGMRPINNIVDISNYVMLEYGQPLHFFDADKLNQTILVRMAKENEEITLLDKRTLLLDTNDIVITDGENPICLAGVMGGNNSGVDENTKNIIIESAIFSSSNVRRTSLKYDLRSEASLRYEKGLNYLYCETAIERACHLLEKYANGSVLTGTISYDEIDKTPKIAKVSLNEINKTLGVTMTLDDCKKSLNNLGFDYTLQDETLTVTIPTRRLDVEPNKADLIEEIGRLYGYANILSVLPKIENKKGEYIGNVKVRKQLSKLLRGLGLDETRTYLLQNEEDSKLFNFEFGKKIELLKPMSGDKKIVRQSILPALLKVIDYNNSRKVNDVFIYEIANTYKDENTETTKIAISMKGNFLINNWNNINVKVDFYLIKGVVENILDYLGFKNRYSFQVSEIPNMHPGKSCVVLLDRKPVGFVGRVHPKTRKDEVYVAELDMTALANLKVKPIKHKEPSKFPEITKDLSFVIKKDCSSEQLMNQIKKSGGRLLDKIEVFDVYVGDNVLENEKSIAYSLTFKDDTRTLEDSEINLILEKIINEVETKMSAKLRR
ncbi:MAG: phenylalanine--tRNA ligase subunit beta [Bacilli bacterium]